jgi:predicted HD phosphohydrolase
VSEPVRLHVAAKRYLCTRELSYWDALSALSRRSLEIQGGPMGAEEASAFEQQGYWREAVQLRRWDDTGKQPAMVTQPFSHFMALAAGCLLRG